MFKAKLGVIKTKGRVIVDTDLELEFDVNGDGLIDKDEAKALREAVEAPDPPKPAKPPVPKKL